MSRQQSDAQVIEAAAKRHAVVAELRRSLRRQGIRSLSSKKAKEAMRRAATLPRLIETPEERFKRLEPDLFKGMGRGEVSK